MKKLKFVFCCIIALVLGFFPTQYCYSDILIKKDDSLPPIPDRGMVRSNTTIPVSATMGDTELFVFFDSAVGIATITVYDETNQIVYQTSIDTCLSLQLAIEAGGWDSGNYTLKIAYDSTKLQGEFQL